MNLFPYLCCFLNLDFDLTQASESYEAVTIFVLFGSKNIIVRPCSGGKCTVGRDKEGRKEGRKEEGKRRGTGAKESKPRWSLNSSTRSGKGKRITDPMCNGA